MIQHKHRCIKTQYRIYFSECIFQIKFPKDIFMMVIEMLILLISVVSVNIATLNLALCQTELFK